MIFIWLSCIVLFLFNCRLNSKFLRFVGIALLALLMSCNNQAVDEVNMANGYYRVISSPNYVYDIATAAYEGILVRIAGLLNLSFGQFNFVVYFVLLWVINSALMATTTNTSIPFLVFAVTSALLDTTLMKQFIATSFIVFAFQFLVREKPSCTKYLIFSVIAATLHFSMAIYIPMVMVRVHISSKTKKRIAVVLGVSLIALTFLNNQKVIGLDRILSFIQSDRLSVYNSAKGVNLGWLYALAIWFVLVFLGRFLEKKAQKYVTPNDYAVISRINMVLIASVIFIPFSTMTLVFIRLFRPLIWLIGLQIAICLKREYVRVRANNMSRNIVFASLTLLTGYAVVFNNIVFSYELCIQPVLEGTFFWIN